MGREKDWLAMIAFVLALCTMYPAWECDNKMIINSLREYKERQTVAKVYVDGEFFGNSLEDVGRPQGVKIANETSIPEGVYKVAITHSDHFERDMMVLYNVDDDHSIQRDDIRFTGIRVHAGTSTDHTAGCILLSNYFVLQTEVKRAIERGESVFWVINRNIL